MSTEPAQVNRGLRAQSRSFRYRHTPRVEVTPTVLGPTISFWQANGFPIPGDNLACSPMLLGGSTANMFLREDGSQGDEISIVLVSTIGIRAHVFMVSNAFEPNLALWQAGTWTVRVNISAVPIDISRIRRCFVCRVDATGVSQATVGSRTDLDIPCTFGVKSWTVTGLETTGNASDRIHIVIGMAKPIGSPPGDFACTIKHNQQIDSPIRRAA